MDLKTFLSYFDFDYDIVSAAAPGEERIRQELLEDGKLMPEDLSKDLICLIDLQGAYFGDIGKERYPIRPDSAAKIIDRMDIYIQDSVFDEFTTALNNREIDTSTMDLGELIAKAKELGVGDGEVCYPLAEAVNNPDSVFIPEVTVQEVLANAPNLKWYENRNPQTGEHFWWTQRDKDGNCFEIQELPISKRLRLLVNDQKRSDYDTLSEAQNAARVIAAELAQKRASLDTQIHSASARSGGTSSGTDPKSKSAEAIR